MRKCRRWELKAPWTADGIFLVSICNIVSWKDSLLHFGIHLAVGTVFGFGGSLGLALGLEIRDGELNRIEGFSIFPDLVVRTAGAVVGGWWLRPFLYGLLGNKIWELILLYLN